MKSERKYLPQVGLISSEAPVWACLHIFSRGCAVAAVMNYSTYYKRRAGSTRARKRAHRLEQPPCRTPLGHRVMDAVPDWP